MNHASLKAFLDKKVKEYNRPSFIANDPISIPHRFSAKADIEIAGFFAAIFAWGNRTTIIQKTADLMQRMDNAPFAFCTQHGETDLRQLGKFVHRTFNSTDLLYFISFFKTHYSKHTSLETAFMPHRDERELTMEDRLNYFYHYFFSLPDVPGRTRKHIASPEKKSSCKRINMFLRWMVRQDNCRVDFGLWKNIKPSELIIPIDLHVGRVARHFGLLDRKQTDWQAAISLTDTLRTFDAHDPVKYDFALFGLGVLEKF
jgi:uncharacterized protein (TIGR02757 family)